MLINNAAAWEGDTFIPPSAGLRNELVELWTKRPSTIDAGIFDRLFAVNARAAALMMAEFARRHVARGANWGRIVNLSTAGAECFPSEISYGASKLALESYTAAPLRSSDSSASPSTSCRWARSRRAGSRLNWKRRFDSSGQDRPAGGCSGRDRFSCIRTGALDDSAEDFVGGGHGR